MSTLWSPASRLHLAPVTVKDVLASVDEPSGAGDGTLVDRVGRHGHRLQKSRCVTPLGLGTESRWKRSSSSSGEVHSRSPPVELDRRDGDVHRVDEVGVEELPDGRDAAAEAHVLAVRRLLRLRATRRRAWPR